MDDRDMSEAASFARYLGKISKATRVIGIIVCIGAVITILVALGQRRTDDQIGFSLIGMGVLLFGILVWSTGTFHGAVARALPTLFAVDRKLDAIGRMLATREGGAPAQPGGAVAPSVAVAPPEIAPPPAPAPAPEPEPEPAPTAETETAPELAPVVRRIHDEPEIVRVPCPHCNGLIHPEATRCVHCMRKVA